MNEEMREHLERSVERLVARGMSREEALIQARREFGNATVIEESARDARGMRWVESLVADVRCAFRYFARNKVTAGIIVAVLALGIGSNITLFSVFQAELYRAPMGVPEDASQLRLYNYLRRERTASWRPDEFTMTELRQLASRRETFSDVMGWTRHDVVLDAVDSTGARGVNAQFVTANYFTFIRVALAAGPGFVRGDDSDMAAIMSFQMAEMLYGNPAEAVGRRIFVNELPVRVAGIAPPGFQGAVRNMDKTVLWMPVSARAAVARERSDWMESNVFEVAARLAPGATVDRAEADVREVVMRSLPDSAQRVGMARRTEVTAMHDPRPDDLMETYMGIAGVSLIGLLILLVACTNVSSLMVAAAVARRHEITVRMSLGASRGRVLRQLVSESTLLAIGGTTIGLGMAWWVLTYFQRTEFDGVNIMPDVGTVVFALLAAVGTGVLFGLSPAFHAMRGGLATAMRDSGGAGATGRSRLQRAFVVAQIVFSQPLLVILGVLLAAVAADYKPLPELLGRRIVSVGFRPLAQTGGPGQRREAVDSLMPKIAAHPEVVSVVPEAAGFEIWPFRVADLSAAVDSTRPMLHVEGAAPGYFALLDIPIVLGRDITLADTGGREMSVVIGSDLARRFWGDANPIGRTLIRPSAKLDTMTLAVVGVYDASHTTTRGSAVPRVYTAHGKEWRRDAILVRTRGGAEPFIPELRRVIREAAPGLPITRLATREMIDRQEQLVTWRMTALAAAGGALALLLASLGLYGVVSLAVQQRRREIGIRIAVGARPGQVARMFLASSVRVGALGLVIGLPVCVVGLKLLLGQSYVIAPDVNPWAIGLCVAAALLTVATGAAWAPARRAARVDPATTLRVE